MKNPFPYRREWDINPRTRVTPKKEQYAGDECVDCRAFETNPEACENCENGG
jgi:hypothetical protein